MLIKLPIVNIIRDEIQDANPVVINSDYVVLVEDAYLVSGGYKLSYVWIDTCPGLTGTRYLVRGTPTEVLAYLKGGSSMQTSVVESKLSSSDLSVLTGAGLTPADVIDWIKAHGFQGAELLRKLLPLFPLDPQVKAVILMILDLLYPPTPVPAP